VTVVRSSETAPESAAAGASPSAWRDLGPRLASGLVLIGAALAALRLGDGVFLLFWLAASVAIAWEWQTMVGGPRVAGRVAVSAAVLAAAGWFASQANADAPVFILVLGAFAVAAIAPERRVWSGCGVLYAGCALVPVCLLRGSVFEGAHAVLWLFVIVWGSDVMAYFVGRAIGGPRLWPRVSPGKTWSGAVAGALGGAIFGAIALFAMGQHLAIVPALGLGVALAAASQAGDLFESFVKRRFGAKDSGWLIPGHGGVMDRLDGFIAAATLAVIIGMNQSDAASAALGLLRWGTLR
jgi:phosphatidate cytidylyltransferase